MLIFFVSSHFFWENFFRSSGWIRLVLMELMNCRNVFREKVERNFLLAGRIPFAENFSEYWEKNPEREFLSLMSKNF